MAGCDPGTLKHFPRLREGPASKALVAKTGTLTTTDGGIAVLAGFVRTARGELMFCVAAPRIGNKLARARALEEQWLLDLIESHGGARPGECGAAVRYSDADVSVAPATSPAAAAPS